jgi:hypothetical protein
MPYLRNTTIGLEVETTQVEEGAACVAHRYSEIDRYGT